MRAYIKSAKTFAATGQRESTDYKLTLDCMEPEKGSVTVAGEDIPPSVAGDWLIINSEPYLISRVSPKKGVTELQTMPVVTLFDRDFAYEESDALTIGGFIADMIDANWINQADAEYQTNYITVTSTDDTPFEAPEMDDDNLFNLLDYITWARQTFNITVHAAINGNALELTISRDEIKTHPLVVNDGHTQLSSSSFDREVMAKLTVFQPVDTGRTDEDDQPIYDMTATDFYLAADGTVSDTVPEERAVGSWGSVTVGKDDDLQERAEAEFERNKETLKVELYSDTEMAVGDIVRVRISGEITEGKINAITRKRGDNRKLYRIGELATTLTDKVNAMQGGTTVVYRSSGGGTSYPAWTGGNY